MRLICARCDNVESTISSRTCGDCGGVLNARYDGELDRGRIEAGDTLFENYSACLPSGGSLAGVEGDTPLHRADGLGELFGSEADVYVKDERRNPTGSFKDRAFAPMLSFAAEAGERTILTASTGNAATACAHYATRGDLDCYLLVDEHTPREKLIEPLLYGAIAVRVEGLFESDAETFETLLESVATNLDAYLAVAHQPLNPLSMEGVKTISYEVAEQLGWSAPDVVVTPVGGGDNVAAQFKGYQELRAASLTDSIPRMVGVQASGAAPLVETVRRGLDEPIEVAPETIASGINAAFTAPHALEAVRDSGGTAVGVSDDDIIEGERTLAGEIGVWAEPSAAAVVPALRRLVRDGFVASSDTVVLTVTGSGYKNVEPILDSIPPVETVSQSVPDIVSALN